MQTYPVNSPEAICRILALAMIVDGHVNPAEIQVMRHAAFLKQVAVDEEVFDRVLRQLCEDLLLNAGSCKASAVEIDPAMLEALLQEIDRPLLQVCLFKTMIDVIEADGHLDTRETLLVRRAARCWFSREARADDAFQLFAGA